MLVKNKEEQLRIISHSIQCCCKCERADTRDHAVPGEGSLDSKVLFLGEAPGKSENYSGRPFVGRAGVYLNKVFSSFSMDRKKVFITSVLKCYHPDSPQKKQIETCMLWTQKQIEILKPELILVMGRTAEFALFGKRREGKHTELRWKGIPCIVTCHPASAMRFPERDKEFKQDFRCLKRMVDKRGLLL